MDANRRGFLRASLVVLGAAASGGVCKCLAQESRQEASGPEPSGSGPVTHAMTPDGQVVQVRDGKVVTHPKPPGDPSVRIGVQGRKWIMVIDLAHCDGCGTCQAACSKMHFIPPTRQYIKVLRMQDAESTTPYYFPQPCYHCDNPPCTKVCPVDATFKRDDGIVAIDNERCIGCRFCMAACPYQARSFNWARPNDPPEARAQPYSPETGFPRRVGTVEKCDFCPEMAAEGKLPTCASSCPMGAIWYGDQNEDAVTNGRGQTVRLSSFLRDNSGYRHMEELGTEPRVYYLPPRSRIYPPPPAVKDIHGHG
jgi:Fe-S-cluster-containing dehydrogenase component